jgi:phage-related protein
MGKIDWLQLGKDILQGIANGLMKGVSIITDAVKDVASSMLDGFKSFFKIGSPSKLMRDEIGQWIPAGIAQGIRGNISEIDSAMDDAMSSTMRSAQAEIEVGTSYGNLNISSEQNIVYNLMDKIDRLSRAIETMQGQKVVLQGDAAAMLKLVERENNISTAATGYNRLAGRYQKAGG